ncbi:MAG: DUF2325 domain-containing protein [Sulfuricurvum sp.]
MSVLVIGGDKIIRLQHMLTSFGVQKTHHWNSRKNSTTHYKFPANLDMVVMLTDFLNHNAMYHFKKEAKKSDIPFVCVKGLSGCSECRIKEMVECIQNKNTHNTL